MSVRPLVDLGWTDELEAAFIQYEERGFEPARVVAEHRGGYLVRGDRVAKYNQLLRIEAELGDAGSYPGWAAFPRAGR